MAQTVKNPPATQETWVWFLGLEDPLEEGTATHSSILAWRIPRTEVPGGLQSMGSQRARHDWSHLAQHSTAFHHSFTVVTFQNGKQQWRACSVRPGEMSATIYWLLPTNVSWQPPVYHTRGMCVCLCVCVPVAQSCLTLCHPVDCSPPGSSVHGILHPRILEWVVIPFCRGFSCPRDRTQVSSIAGRFFTLWATKETMEY